MNYHNAEDIRRFPLRGFNVPEVSVDISAGHTLEQLQDLPELLARKLSCLQRTAGVAWTLGLKHNSVVIQKAAAYHWEAGLAKAIQSIIDAPTIYESHQQSTLYGLHALSGLTLRAPLCSAQSCVVTKVSDQSLLSLISLKPFWRSGEDDAWCLRAEGEETLATLKAQMEALPAVKEMLTFAQNPYELGLMLEKDTCSPFARTREAQVTELQMRRAMDYARAAALHLYGEPH